MNSDGLSQLSSLIYNDFKNVNNVVSEAYNKANVAYDSVSAAYDKANSAYDSVSAAYNKANSAYDSVSAAYNQANAAYNKANSAYSYASSAYSKADSASDSAYYANKLRKSSLRISTNANGCGNLGVNYFTHYYLVPFAYAAADYVTTPFMVGNYWWVRCQYTNGQPVKNGSFYVTYTYKEEW